MHNEKPDRGQVQKRPRQSPLKGFGQIVAGNGIGQLVTFFVLPILSRLYSPEEFGVLSLVLSIAAVAAPLALMGMHLALIQPRDDYDVAPLVFSGLLTLGLLCITTAGVVVFWPTLFGFEGENSAFLSWALPIIIFLTGTNLVLNQLVTRAGSYGSIGKRNGIQSVSISVAQLALGGTAGLACFNGLVGGNLLGILVGVLIMLPFLKGFLRKVKIRECFNSLKEYRKFIFVFSPMASLTLLLQQTPIIFVIYWYGQSDGGQVGMAERLVAVPLALVGLAGGAVFLGEFSHAVRNGRGDVTRIYLKMSKFLMILGGVVALSFLLLSPPILPAFLGEGWDTAVKIVQVMAIVAGTRIISNPLRGVFGVLGHARLITIAELIRFILLAVALIITMWAALPLLSALVAIYGAMAAADLLIWVFGLLASKEFDKNLATPA